MSVGSDRNDLQGVIHSREKRQHSKEIIWKYNNDYITFRVRMVKKKTWKFTFFFLKDLNYTINSGYFFFFLILCIFFIEV